jgi:hypothetical protein
MAYCRIQDWVEPETERSTTNYDQISGRIRPKAEGAQGFIAHAAGWTGNGFRIIEIWESEDDCERFFAEVVMPVVMEVSGGDPGRQPATTGYELHNLVTAGRG